MMKDMVKVRTKDMVEVRDMKASFTKIAYAVFMAMIIVLLAGLTSEMTFAAGKENDKIPALTQDKSKFVIEFSYTDDDVTTPISGATFTAYKLATITIKDGSARYTLTKDFEDLDVDIQNMDAEASFNVADKSSEMVIKKGLTGITAKSGKDGKANFGEVENGIYLVKETDATGDAKKYERLSPWLVEVPELNGDYQTGYSWGYDVVAMPKPLVGKYEEEEPPHYTPPDDDEEEGGDGEEKEKYESNPLRRLVRTGDEGMIFIYAGVLLVAMGGLLVVIKRRKKSE